MTKKFNCEKMCRKFPVCKKLCEVGEFLADGNAPMHEDIIDNLPKRAYAENYNDVLYKLMRDRENSDAGYIERIRQIDDILLRAVAAMLYAHISPTEMADARIPRNRTDIYALIAASRPLNFR